MSRAVHVKGRGALTPFGCGVDAFLEGVFEGRSAIRPFERLAGTDCLTSVAAEFVPEVARELSTHTDLPLAIAEHASRQALAEAGEPKRGQVGILLATTKGDLSGVWGEGRGLGNPARLCDALADRLELGGRRLAVSCACASGLSALALGARWIRSGELDDVLVVGVDTLSAFVLRGFSSLLALDSGPCRPFDVGRKGLNLGEAAGALCLSSSPGEALSTRLVGWGESNDANHITGPSRDGEGLRMAASRALERAGLTARDIDYVHLHGTGTIYNDEMEAKAVARLFDGKSALASGTKAQTGHTLGAAGLIESLVAIEALRRQEAPANLRLQEVGVHPGLNLARERTALDGARYALKLAAGFGGINAALVFES